MNIVSAFRPPRLVEIGGESFWVKPLCLEDFALLVAWLDDVLPGRAERHADRALPKLSDQASRDALDTDYGRVVVVWTALRHLGVSYADAARRAVAATDGEMTRLFDVLMARVQRAEPPSGGGEDIAEAKWWPAVASLCERYSMTPTDVGRLSMDQLDMLCEIDPDEIHDPVAYLVRHAEHQNGEVN